MEPATPGVETRLKERVSGTAKEKNESLYIGKLLDNPSHLCHKADTDNRGWVISEVNAFARCFAHASSNEDTTGTGIESYRPNQTDP